ncbi:MAG TPA: right-handed parallel beta-helix repeat-containing protein [Lysobacter sp.]
MIRCLSLLLLALCLAGPAAAETTECTNITTLPTVISTQGIYCLKQDLSTAITTGAAITIATNNVTIDCNGRKLGGLAAGPGTQTTGIHATTKQNITVRDCNIRGFRAGLLFDRYGNNYSGGHLVENNLFDANTMVGIELSGDYVTARRNRVINTGGTTLLGDIIALAVSGQPALADDNYVGGVTGSTDASADTIGLRVSGYMSLARDNVVTDVNAGSGTSASIAAGGTQITLEHNSVFNVGTPPQYGVDTTYSSVLCINNRVRGYTINAYDECDNGGGNYPAIP